GSAPSPDMLPPRSLTTTAAPRRARSSAYRRPRPRPAPVTITAWRENSITARPWRSLAESGERVDVVESGIDGAAKPEARFGARLDSGDRGAVHLDVLDALVGLVRSLVVVDLAARPGERQRVPRHHLMDREQLAVPSELAAPCTLVAHGVDVQLNLAEQVVLVARHAFDDPVTTKGQGRG